MSEVYRRDAESPQVSSPSLSTSVIHKIAKERKKMGFSVSTATNPSYMY